MIINKDNLPFVTFLICVYNGQKYIKDCIDSVLNQDYPNIKIMVIDDCSTDNTSKIINSYKNKNFKIYRNKKNIGLTKSLNFGIENCTTDFIARLDHDDICLPYRVSSQIDKLMKYQDSILCVSSYIEIDIEKNENKVVYERLNLKEYKNRLKKGQGCFLHSTAMIRIPKKDNGKKFLKYDETFKYGQDQALWIEILSESNPIIVDKPLVIARRKHSSSISFNRSLIRKFIIRLRLILKARKYFKETNNKFLLTSILKLIIELIKVFIKKVI